MVAKLSDYCPCCGKTVYWHDDAICPFRWNGEFQKWIPIPIPWDEDFIPDLLED